MKKPVKKVAKKAAIWYDVHEDSDGTKTYKGTGGGSVIVPNQYNQANIVTYTKKPRISRKNAFLHCLLAVKEQMPQEPITLSDVATYKEECRVILEALREGRAQFFRDIGDMLQNQGAPSASQAEKSKRQHLQDCKILSSISVAFSILGKPPKFKTLLDEAQKHTGLGDKLTAQKLKKRLKAYGFEWLGDC